MRLSIIAFTLTPLCGVDGLQPRAPPRTTPTFLSSYLSELLTGSSTTTRAGTNGQDNSIDFFSPATTNYNTFPKASLLNEDKVPSTIILPDETVMAPLAYAQIQQIIDVSRPYYNLRDEHLVYSSKTGVPAGFVCQVKAEMPLGREAGEMASGEAGRHMAIAGSVAAALNNPKDGKHYYLALDVEFEQFPVELVFLLSLPTSAQVTSTAILPYLLRFYAPISAIS